MIIGLFLYRQDVLTLLIQLIIEHSNIGEGLFEKRKAKNLA
jgi:hypothetical protein